MGFGWLHLSLYHGLIILGELLAIAALLHMLYQRRTPTSMIAWLLAMVLLPYLAVPLYFILETRKRHSKHSKSAFYMHELPESFLQVNAIDGILRSNGIPVATNNNQFELYIDGSRAFHALMRQINTARCSVRSYRQCRAYSQKAYPGSQFRILQDQYS